MTDFQMTQKILGVLNQEGRPMMTAYEIAEAITPSPAWQRRIVSVLNALTDREEVFCDEWDIDLANDEVRYFTV